LCRLKPNILGDDLGEMNLPPHIVVCASQAAAAAAAERMPAAYSVGGLSVF
jgi:hypothetical protein